MIVRVVPLELREANAFVEQHHRHHKPVQGHRWSLGIVDDAGVLHGCAIVGRPTSGLDPRRIVEVTRLCTDGSMNACSMLYSAAARAAREMGFEIIQTYIFESEHGSSLKASGWYFDRAAHPSGRHRARSDGKTRDTELVAVRKTLWRKRLNGTSEDFAHHKDGG